METNGISVEKLHAIFLSAEQKICTDTRKIEAGSVFFALKGDNFDGNKFAQKAIDAGCAFAVVDDATLPPSPKILFTPNVLRTLQALANFHRKTVAVPVLAITGSNGKTTTKELINAVLSKKFRCLATYGNLNNHIGVPLTLLGIKPEHEFAIIEMGANHQGEIEMLCKIAEPGYGIITNIGRAHLEGFGGPEGVKKGKSELYRYLKENHGIAIVHADDPVLLELAKDNDKYTFGTTRLFDVVGKPSENNGFVEFKWKTRYTAGSLSSAELIKTHLVGKYNYYNLLCAAATGNYFHVEEKQINEALSEYIPSNNRSQLFDSGKNKLILDMYNANPSSMEAAIENFSAMKNGSKMLILGDMLELGTESGKEHAGIVELLKQKNLSDCILIGPEFYSLSATSNLVHFKDASEAAEFLEKHPQEGKTILIKGSRGIKLETLVPLL
jgi:UDP-N-acetylmuramoyl-tripeptide--D-alanyl-D-alanine ligase